LRDVIEFEVRGRRATHGPRDSFLGTTRPTSEEFTIESKLLNALQVMQGPLILHISSVERRCWFK
jgi:hypothetical protein